jgi:DNA invertase Pin-like site-specific DNA recombinase
MRRRSSICAWQRSTKRAALYLRVSTDGQTTENRHLALEGVAAQRGWTVAISTACWRI